MKNRWMWIVSVLILLLGVAVWILKQRGAGAGDVDLIDRFSNAEKRTLMADKSAAFSVIDATINGEIKRAIFTRPASRIIWRVTIPKDAWLRTSLALKPEAWAKPGDGVYFRIAVSDGRNYEELLAQQVNPGARPGDRRWIPVNLDLSAYADQAVEVIFNTNTSPPKAGDDRRNDLALWGAPQIYVR